MARKISPRRRGLRKDRTLRARGTVGRYRDEFSTVARIRAAIKRRMEELDKDAP